MIVHLLKMVWHRKRTNALVMAEIFLSFLIVFAIVTMTVSLVSRWRTPLGFDWRNVWMIEIDNVLSGKKSSTTDGPLAPTPADEKAEQLGRIQATDRLIRALRSFPEVEAAAADSMTPYSDNGWNGAITVDGRSVNINVDRASDDFAKVMRMPVVSGRWFTREDDGQNYEPVVLDTNAARALFNDPAPLGKKFASVNFVDSENGKDFRVVGVIAPYRKDGEFSDQNLNMMFMRTSFTRVDHPLAERIVIRVRPGTPGSFEAALNDRLHRLADVTFRIKRMEDMRQSALKARFVPIAILTVVALFLISMVALGLTGVLWQTVTRRMREMGLRRAVGATGRGVRAQVLGEVAVLSTLSVILGAIVVLQLPLLGIFQAVKPAEFTTGFIAAIIVIYAITLTCGGYPSWLASRIEPADALRYE